MNQSLTLANFTTSVRYFLTLAISYAAGRGWITTDTASNMGVLAVALIPYAWALYTNSINKAASDEGVITAVRAGIAAGSDPTTPTPPASAIGTLEAKAIVSTYAPK